MSSFFSLEEYLQDLVGNLTEEERRNLPKHAESLNFSQAALVLQNSSNVYSRKVEYLYKLVVQVHDELIQSSSSGNATSANGSSRKSSKDAQIEEFNSFDPHSEFLLLDDCLPVAENGKNINLQETRDDVSRDSGLSFATAATTTRLSLGATMATNMERSVTPGAGVFATQHITSGSFNTGSLRLIDGKCDVGEDGILILPGAGRKSEEKIRRSSIFGSNMSPRSRSNAFDQLPGQPQSGSDSFAMHDGDNYDDGGDDGGGFGFGDGDGNGFGDENTGVESTTTMQNGHQQSTPRRGTSTEKNKPMEKKDDPWALLDAHSQGTLTKSREHKFGTTCKLPAGVSELPSENNKEPRTKRSRRITPPKISARRAKHARQSLALESFKSNLFAQRRRSKILANSSNKNGFFSFDVDMTEIPMKGLIFGDEFLYIANETTRLKRAQARAESKQSKIARQNMEDIEHNKYVDDDDGFGAMDYGGDDDDGGNFGFGDDDDDQQDDEIGNTGVGNLDDMFKSHHHEGDNEVIDTEGKTFEELCRAHIQAFAKGAEAYAAETRLSKRVGDWHDNLIPILENEEHRPEFDIYDYTLRVVSTCENELTELNDENDLVKKRTIGFDAVTRDCERFEVCRLFLSVLALSNSGNVKLHHGDFDENLELTLLDANLDRPMETYLAPSVVEDE